ncbi:flowering-promoting factor 1-like protein 3 [Ananas comosus]|uniref:Flowering-promoting factor 1-like protein 3 n=2 Tax=Ananas comosus TaxID=4615 RepID=A0A199V761_ANACO|nr:flowering-promoting factor 1-like protein 3 [Ananas comosus]OAY72922.1 Flowering-promoting factor 1-like protein 3 [Ananas comosus]CAD1824825.1 unnamed protein product [Ananas comosus var. bracteatus]
MSDVWLFDNGVLRRRVGRPGGTGDSGDGRGSSSHGGGDAAGRRKVLVHVPTGQIITSYEMLEQRLAELGWERYHYHPELLQFHQRSSVHLISLPREFSRLRLVNMYDIVVKTRNVFEVRDA